VIDNIQDYFTEELALLRELGYTIAGQQGTTSCNTSDPSQWGNEPAVEQLLTGCAWLTARVKHQFDHYQLDWQEQMLRYLMPDALRPMPAMTIVVWQDLQARCGETVIIPTGTPVTNVDPELTECERAWQTTQRVSLHPVTVSKCGYQTDAQHGALLEIELTLNVQVNAQKFHLTELVFYLNAPSHLAHRLYYLLLHPETTVFYQTDAHSNCFAGNPFAAYWCESDEQSVTYLSSDAQRLLQWYASFPQQLLFIRLTQLAKVIWSKRSRTLHLRIQLPDTCALGSRIGSDTLLLNCCPLINLWQRALEPVKLKRGQENYRLVFNTADEELHHISQVTGYCRQQHLSMPLTPFNYLQQIDQDTVYYRLLRRQQQRNGYRYELALAGSRLDQLDYVIVTLLICARNIANVRQLPIDFTWESANGLSDLFQIKSLVLPGQWQSAPTGQHIMQRLAQCLQRGHMSVDYLRREFDYASAVVNRDGQKRIATLSNLHLEPFHSLVKGVVQQGVLLTADIDERDFDSQATVFFLWLCRLSILPIDQPTWIAVAITVEIDTQPRGVFMGIGTIYE
jgi:type VI secretion system protein ImpG